MVSKNSRLLYQSLQHLAFMGLATKELQISKRAFNLLGHIFLNWKLYSKSIDAFGKLGECTYLDGDLSTLMYSYKQIGFCYQKLKEYQVAVKCFKK